MIRCLFNGLSNNFNLDIASADNNSSDQHARRQQSYSVHPKEAPINVFGYVDDRSTNEEVDGSHGFDLVSCFGICTLNCSNLSLSLLSAKTTPASVRAKFRGLWAGVGPIIRHTTWELQSVLYSLQDTYSMTFRHCFLTLSGFYGVLRTIWIGLWEWCWDSKICAATYFVEVRTRGERRRFCLDWRPCCWRSEAFNVLLILSTWTSATYSSFFIWSC